MEPLSNAARKSLGYHPSTKVDGWTVAATAEASGLASEGGFETEVWRPVPATDWRYLVSSLGRVKGPTRTILGGYLNTAGYPAFTVSRPGDKGNWLVPVHRAVCWAFNGPPPFEGALVRHLDGVKTNNVPANLVWGTYVENAADRATHGTVARGSQVAGSRLTEEAVRAIRDAVRQGRSASSLAPLYGVSQSAIQMAASGRTWGWVT